MTVAEQSSSLRVFRVFLFNLPPPESRDPATSPAGTPRGGQPAWRIYKRAERLIERLREGGDVER